MPSPDRTQNMIENQIARIPIVAVGPVTLDTADDNGKSVIANLAGLAIVAQLPPVRDHLIYTIKVLLLPTSGAGTAFSPNAADSINGGADDADLVNTAATDAIGDFITVVGDEALGTWWVVAQKGVWA